MIHIEILELEEYSLLFADTSRGEAKPIDLQKLIFPPVKGSKGLIISAPVAGWIGDVILLHYRNKTSWVGRYDPNKKGAIVTLSLCPQKVMGEFIEIKLPCLKCWDNGNQKFIRAGAKFPYCTDHQDAAPHRQ